MIEFIHTSKSFGRQKVHKDINLTVPTGKITYIIGPSGTGKSVFLKQVIGLLKPDAGQILLDGEDLVKMDAAEMLKTRSRFGMLFQNAALFDSMTIFENVAFPLREHTKLKGRELADLVHNKLGQVGLQDADRKMPSELSGGMRKRVGLARAIVMEPEIMLYDEPTTGLDPIMTDVIDTLIYDTQKGSGMTSIIVSHDIKSAMRLADRIVMIYDGYVVLEGTADEFKMSDNPIVRQFLAGSREGPIQN